MIHVNYALRDERINVLALTGRLHGVEQIILCKKQPIPLPACEGFLLDAKSSKSTYSLSPLGSSLEQATMGEEPELRYIAFVDSYLKIRPSRGSMQSLCEKHFAIWDPEAPFQYFAGLDEGYLAVLRILELPYLVSPEDLQRGRSGRNFYYRVDAPISVERACTVHKRGQFELLKSEIISLLSNGGHLVSVEEPGTARVGKTMEN